MSVCMACHVHMHVQYSTVEPLYCRHHCMGQENASSLERCPYFRGLICTQIKGILFNGTSETVLVREVSLLKRLIEISETVLVREVSLLKRLIGFLYY